MYRHSNHCDRLSGSHRSHRPPWDGRSDNYERADTETTFHDTVSMQPRLPVANPCICSGAGPLPRPGCSTESYTRSESTSPRSTSLDVTPRRPIHHQDTLNHSIGGTRVLTCMPQPEDGLRNHESPSRPTHRSLPLPEGPFEVPRDPRPTTIDPDAHRRHMPSGTLHLTSLGLPVRTLSASPTTRRSECNALNAQSSTESASVALKTTVTELKHLEAAVSPYLHSHKSDMHSQMPVSPRSEPRNATTASTTANSSFECDYNDEIMQSQSHSHDSSLKGSIYSVHSYNAHLEERALSLDPKDYDLLDTDRIINFVPYAPDTTMYALRSELAEQHTFMPASAALTSAVQLDKEANYSRRIFRRLGRDLYGLRMPTPEEARYPSQSCEAWASHIFQLLDTVVTFRPTCLITNDLIPAQEIDYWPEFGELYIAYSCLIDRSVTEPSDHDSMFPIPEWPASDHLFHTEAFEIAAVSFRDQMERSIQKLYDLITVKSVDRTRAPTFAIEQFSYDNPMQEDLHDRFIQSRPDHPLTAPTKLKATSSPSKSLSGKLFKINSINSLSNSETPSSPTVITEDSINDLLHIINKWLETTAQSSSATIGEPKSAIGDTRSNTQPYATALQAHTSVAMRSTLLSANNLPTARVSNLSSDSPSHLLDPHKAITPSTEPLPQESSMKTLQYTSEDRHFIAVPQETTTAETIDDLIQVSKLPTLYTDSRAPNSESPKAVSAISSHAHPSITTMPVALVSQTRLTDQLLAPRSADPEVSAMSVDSRILQAPPAHLMHSIVSHTVGSMEEAVSYMRKLPVRAENSQLPSQGTTPPELGTELPESTSKLEFSSTGSVSAPQKVTDQPPTSLDGTIQVQSTLDANLRPIGSPVSVVPTEHSPPARERPKMSSKPLRTIEGESRTRIHQSLTPRPDLLLASAASTSEPSDSTERIDTWVITPIEPQPQSQPSISNRLISSSLTSSGSQQPEDIPEEPSLEPLAETIGRLAPISSADTHALDHNKSIISSLTQANSSQAPSIDISLLDMPNWYAEVMSQLEQLTEQNKNISPVHTTKTGTSSEANSQPHLSESLSASTLTDLWEQTSSEPPNSSLIMVPEPRNAITPPQEPLPQDSSRNLLYCPTSSQLVSLLLAKTAPEVVADNTLITSLPVCDIESYTPCVDTMMHNPQNCLSKVSSEVKLSVGNCASPNPMCLSSRIMPVTAENRNQLTEELTALSSACLDDITADYHQHARRLQPLRSDCSLVPLTSTGGTKTWAQIPSAPQEESCRSQNRETTATSSSSLCNSSTQQKQLCAESAAEAPAEPLARPVPTQPEGARVLEEYITGEEQESIGLNDLPLSVSANRCDLSHVCASPGPANGSAPATNTVTHITHVPVAESAPDKPQEHLQQSTNHQTSSASSHSCPVSSPLQKKVPTEPIPHRPALSSNVSKQTEDELINQNNIVVNDQLGTSSPTLECDAVQSQVDSSASTRHTATDTTHELIAESALETPLTDEQRLLSLQTSTSSSCLSLVHPSLQEQVPTEPASDRPTSVFNNTGHMEELLNQDSIVIHQLFTLTSTLGYKSDFLQGLVDTSASTMMAITRTTHALAAESALMSLRTDDEQLSSLQGSTVSPYSRLRDPLLPDKAPELPTLYQLPQVADNSSLISILSVPVLDELIEHNNDIIVRLNTPASVAAENHESPHIFTSANDPVTSVTCSATWIDLVTIADSTSREQLKDERIISRSLAPDLPSHANRFDQRTGLEELRRPQGTTSPANHLVRPKPVGSEQEPNRHRPPTVERRRSPPSEHSRNRTEALPPIEPITSPRAACMARQPHTAARPVVTSQPMNRSDLPAHIPDGMAKSQRLSEMYEDDPPQARFRDRIAPIPEGNGDGEDPPGDGDSYSHSSNEHKGWRHNPSQGSPDASGDDPDSEPTANAACTQPFRHAPVHLEPILEPDIIPEWTGDTKTLSRWITLINNNAEHGKYTSIQPRLQVSLRFTVHELRWFYVLDKVYPQQIASAWPSLQRAITMYFINRAFMERNEADMLNARLREKSRLRKSPEAYVIHKAEAPTILSKQTDSELITEMMYSTAEHWSLHTDKSLITTWDNFLDKIAWQEEKSPQSNECTSSDIQQGLDELRAMISNLEIDEHSDPDTDCSHQEDNKDLSDDNAYTQDNESETGNEPSEQDSHRNLRSFATFVRAYTPEGLDVSQKRSAGDNTNQSFDLSRRIDRPTTELWESMPSDTCNTRLSNEITFGNELRCKMSTPCAPVEPKIDLTQVYKNTEAKFNNPTLVQCVNMLTSKHRDVVPGGDTWDASDLWESFIYAKQSFALPLEVIQQIIEELQNYLGCSDLTTFIEHNALAWINTYNYPICKLTTRDSAFPPNPGIQSFFKADCHFRQTGVIDKAHTNSTEDSWSKYSLKYIHFDEIDPTTLWREDEPLIKIERHMLITLYYSRAPGIVNNALENSIKDVWSKIPTDCTYSDNSNTHTSVDQSQATLPSKLLPLIRMDCSAQATQHLYQRARINPEQLLDLSTALTLGELDAAQGYQHTYYDKDKLIVIFEQDNRVLLNRHLQQVQTKEPPKEPESGTQQGGLLKVSGMNSAVAYKIHLCKNHIAQQTHIDNWRIKGERVIRHKIDRRFKRTSIGEDNITTDEQPIKWRIRQIKSYQTRYGPPKKAPDKPKQWLLRDQRLKDNPQ